MRVSRLIIHERLQLLGWNGLVGIGCLLLALVYLLLGLLPAWQQLQQQEAQLSQETRRQQRIAAGLEVIEKPTQPPLEVFHQALPGQLDATTTIDRIYALAKQQSIDLDSGEYALSIDPKTHLARYQISLPVRGSYPQLRGFLHALLDVIPGLVLEDVDVQRTRISDSELSGRLRMTLYLSRQS